MESSTTTTSTLVFNSFYELRSRHGRSLLHKISMILSSRRAEDRCNLSGCWYGHRCRCVLLPVRFHLRPRCLPWWYATSEPRTHLRCVTQTDGYKARVYLDSSRTATGSRTRMLSLLLSDVFAAGDCPGGGDIAGPEEFYESGQMDQCYNNRCIQRPGGSWIHGCVAYCSLDCNYRSTLG